MRKTVRVEVYENELAKLDLAAATSAAAPQAGLDAGTVVGSKL